MGKSTYDEFRGLLRVAICNRKQALFAKEAGISPEHLNRMLNAVEINRPSKQTLMKIANVAYNGITYDELETALNKEDPDYHEETYADLKLAEARNDFKRSFEERADACFALVKDCITEVMEKNKSYAVHDLNDVMEEVVAAYKLKTATIWDLKDMMFSYDIGIAREYFGHIHDDVTHWASVILTLAESTSIAESSIILYFSYLPKADIIVLQYMSMALTDIIDLYGYPTTGLEFWKKKGLSEAESLEAIESEEYLFKFTNSMTKQSIKRFFDWLTRPEGESRIEITHGFGFDITEIPKNYAKFISLHKHSVLDAYKKNMNEYSAISKELECLISNKASNEEFAELLDSYPRPTTDAPGWQAAISAVMRLETGFPYYDYIHQEPNSEFPDISVNDYVLIEEDDRITLGIHETTLISVTCKYAKQLGIEYFGDVDFAFVVTEDLPRRKRRFKVNESNEYNVPEDEFAEWISVDEELPEKSGMYWVTLKDGREYQMFYFASKHLWIAKHVEWSSMVASWDRASAITDIKEDAAQEWIDDYDKDWNDDVS